jgi:hypothetical protein
MGYRITVVFTSPPKSVIAIDPENGKRGLYVLSPNDIEETEDKPTDD